MKIEKQTEQNTSTTSKKKQTTKTIQILKGESPATSHLYRTPVATSGYPAARSLDWHSGIYIYIYIYIYCMCVYIYIYIYTCIYVYICVYMCIYVCVCIYIYIYTYYIHMGGQGKDSNTHSHLLNN